jgi:hypothetical protein
LIEVRTKSKAGRNSVRPFSHSGLAGSFAVLIAEPGWFEAIWFTR